MSHRHVEVVIGRLVTDEAFRGRFISQRADWLAEISASGLELSHAELAALESTDPTAWLALADAIDPRLQKASLKPFDQGSHS